MHYGSIRWPDSTNLTALTDPRGLFRAASRVTHKLNQGIAMQKILITMFTLFALGALSACATSGYDRDRNQEQKSLADKWDEDQAKQDERTQRPTAQERLDRATSSTTDRISGPVNGTLGGDRGLIGR